MTVKFVSTLEVQGLYQYNTGELKMTLPPEDTEILTCRVPIGNDCYVKAWAVGEDYIFVGPEAGYTYGFHHHPYRAREVEPFITAEVVGKSYHKTVLSTQRGNYSNDWRDTNSTQIDSYGETYDYSSRHRNPGTPWNYVKVKVTTPSGETSTLEFKFMRPEAGTAYIPEDGPTVRILTDLFGTNIDWSLQLTDDPNQDYYHRQGWTNAYTIFNKLEVKPSTDALWYAYFRTIGIGKNPVSDKGVKAIESKKEMVSALKIVQETDPIAYSFFLWLHDDRTRDGVYNNMLIAAFLKSVGANPTAIIEGLRGAMVAGLKQPCGSDYSGWRGANSRPFCFLLEGAKDKDEERRSKKEWNLRKNTAEQAEGLGVDKAKHPNLWSYIEKLEIPLSIFHEPGKLNEPCNREFDLWEKALKRPGWAEVLTEIAGDASRRTTYEKNVTPYISFLFKIEKYLDRNTRKGPKWKAMPKFVSTQWELEMAESEKEGTSKKRSALTPVADDEARTITVPYASMAIHGRQTTYCYSLNYYVFEENSIDAESETPIVHELETKLNGRDDYGLMYYTLTGTARNQGYPTFLIIFERLAKRTRVHFHRVHPCRSKDGIATPACKLVEECYRYMAGNVRAEEICAQQGDLLFIKVDAEREDVVVDETAKPVKDFESHAFISAKKGGRVLLVPNKSKSVKNRLGYLYSKASFKVDHPEHEPIEELPAGLYEVRRCRSWEANPTAVWSYTID